MRCRTRETIHPLDHPVRRPRRQGRLGIVFIHHGEVIENILTALKHLARSVIENHREFRGKRWIISAAVGDGACNEMTRTILVLQALATQRGSSGSRSDEEAPRPLISRSPNEISHSLKSKHGVEDIERQHGQAMHAVGGRCCDPGR